jgi:toxin-antitoxin system PIN domain toxin
VILIDANLLLYAYVTSYDEHARARQWLELQFNGATPVGLPWPSLLAFARLIANPKIYPQPISVAQAWEQVRIWLARENVWVPLPTNRHADILDGLIPTASRNPKLVPDAHLAALAIEHGLTLCSNDMGFGRFPNLRWVNPLLA